MKKMEYTTDEDMRYPIEVEFVIKKYNIGMLAELRSVAEILSKLEFLGLGVERDSFHYIEQTYFRWENDSLNIKLFWCDEKNNNSKFCLEGYVKEDKIIFLKNIKNILEKNINSFKVLS